METSKYNILKLLFLHINKRKIWLKTTKEQEAQAANIIKEKQLQTDSFGWKDPRSTLFLDLWHKIEPSINFILLYRSPSSVIDSLRRRGTDRRLRVFPWLPATAWLRYNSDILEFHKRSDTNTILINIDSFNRYHETSSKALESWLGFELNRPYTDVYHAKEFSTSTTINHSSLLKLIDNYYHKRLYDLYQELESEAITNTLDIL